MNRLFAITQSRIGTIDWFDYIGIGLRVRYKSVRTTELTIQEYAKFRKKTFDTHSRLYAPTL